MSDRLLSEQYIIDEYYHDHISDDDETTTFEDFKKTRNYKFAIDIAKAQDTKTTAAVNAEWIERVEAIAVREDCSHEIYLMIQEFKEQCSVCT
jgi:hypothetical protein